MNNTAVLIGFVGYGSITFALIVLGRLSQRLNSVTHTPSYYIGLYIAAFVLVAGRLAHTLLLIFPPRWVNEPRGEIVLTLLGSALPAVSITISLVIVWYYWSWLLAERD